MSLTIVITGASRGLGAGMAQFYFDKGYNLGLCSRSGSIPSLLLSSNKSNTADNTGKDSVIKQRVLSASVDVRDEKSVVEFTNHVVQKFGKIDLWINNAGILHPMGPIRTTKLEDFETNIQINLSGVFNGTKSFINHVRQRQEEEDNGDGLTTPSTLVNISSGAALKPYAGWGAYCASKAAVDRLTECALEEEKTSTNLRAYAVAPGVIDTDMQEIIRSSTEEQFPMVKKFVDIKEMGSFNTPPYVAQQILNLALDQTTHQTLPVVQRIPNEKKS
eukprot:CAMPEP_0195301832 /NCGR_PEP_ID=MMETSP0707-20130614/30032_1 /TAXON_ID=33640 /ORGANISM="Asterionellopsis glacialis, Strain CCMP134" /LENGTH=274 /DNA_ID=CAMNT_0040364911 /DNA_START=82 /DNA_END=906 /DNA_ORIENTATION=+